MDGLSDVITAVRVCSTFLGICAFTFKPIVSFCPGHCWEMTSLKHMAPLRNDACSVGPDMAHRWPGCSSQLVLCDLMGKSVSTFAVHFMTLWLSVMSPWPKKAQAF